MEAQVTIVIGGKRHTYITDKEVLGKILRTARHALVKLEKTEGKLPKVEKDALDIAIDVVADFALY